MISMGGKWEWDLDQTMTCSGQPLSESVFLSVPDSGNNLPT